MQIFKNVLKFIIISYLIYIFVFSVLIFAFHKSTNKEDIATELSKQMPYNRTNDRVALIE